MVLLQNNIAAKISAIKIVKYVRTIQNAKNASQDFIYIQTKHVHQIYVPLTAQCVNLQVNVSLALQDIILTQSNVFLVLLIVLNVQMLLFAKYVNHHWYSRMELVTAQG